MKILRGALQEAVEAGRDAIGQLVTRVWLRVGLELRALEGPALPEDHDEDPPEDDAPRLH